MAEPGLVLPLDSKKVEGLIRTAVQRLGAGRVARFWQAFVRRETGVLKRSLSILISREGPIGLNRWWRRRIGFSVMGAGVELVGRVSHDAVPYKEVIEFGRNPNRTPPPHQALIPWMRVKGWQGMGGSPLSGSREAWAAKKLAVFIGRRGTFQPGDPTLQGQPGPGLKQYARTMAANRDGITERAVRDLTTLISEALS